MTFSSLCYVAVRESGFCFCFIPRECFPFEFGPFSKFPAGSLHILVSSRRSAKSTLWLLILSPPSPFKNLFFLLLISAVRYPGFEMDRAALLLCGEVTLTHEV